MAEILLLSVLAGALFSGRCQEVVIGSLRGGTVWPKEVLELFSRLLGAHETFLKTTFP